MGLLSKTIKRQLRKSALRKANPVGVHIEEDGYESIKKYRWILKDSTGNVIFDTAQGEYGYRELVNQYPVVYDALEYVSNVEKETAHSKHNKKSSLEIVIMIDSKLNSFFPSEDVQRFCMAV